MIKSVIQPKAPTGNGWQLAEWWQPLPLASTKPYPHGSIIRPHKELNRVLNQRKASNDPLRPTRL